MQRDGPRDGILSEAASPMKECDSTDRIVSVWVDSGRMSVAELEAIRRHTAVCAACDRQVGTLLPLMERDVRGEQFAPPAAEDPPGGLTAAVMERVANRSEPARSRAGARVPVLAAAAVILAVCAGLTAYRAGFLRGSAEETDVMAVRFELAAPEARSVFLVGDFTDWQEKRLKLEDRDGDGVWEVTARLRKGRAYSYNFLVDGEEWVVDPKASVNVEDGFGGMSSVIVL